MEVWERKRRDLRRKGEVSCLSHQEQKRNDTNGSEDCCTRSEVAAFIRMNGVIILFK